MKKLLCVLALFAGFFGTVFAVPTAFNETHEENWSDFTYVNVPILKILDGHDAYVVIYQKNKFGVGETVVPKNWTKGNVESPAKLKMRALDKGTLKPFMTVVKKGGSFYRVMLTVPKNKRNSVWGIVSSGTKLDGADKETLEEIEL